MLDAGCLIRDTLGIGKNDNCGFLGLNRHLSAEKEMLCSEIVEIDSEEVIEERLARSRKLRLQLRQLRVR